MKAMSGTRKFALFLIYSGVVWIVFWVVKLWIDPTSLGATTRPSEIFTSVLYVVAGAVPIVFGVILKAISMEKEEPETDAPASGPRSPNNPGD
jgi:hypothetical protein